MSKMVCDTRENVRFLSENGKSFWLRGSSWRSGTQSAQNCAHSRMCAHFWLRTAHYPSRPAEKSGGCISTGVGSPASIVVRRDRQDPRRLLICAIPSAAASSLKNVLLSAFTPHADPNRNAPLTPRRRTHAGRFTH